MATSTGKTVGLILLVLVIVFLSLRMTPLILAPLGLFTGAAHIVKMPGISAISNNPWFPRTSGLSFVSFVLFLVWIAVVIWVYRDAESRGMNGVLWALLVFIGNLIGLLIYLIVRSDPGKAPPKEAAAALPCPQCQKPVSPGFAFCPYCGGSMHSICPGCSKPTKEDWKACPHCGHKLKD
ncbi:MAG: zinc ribbon domain-containing protein [Candidatus Aminicenantaceae bacterium]